MSNKRNLTMGEYVAYGVLLTQGKPITVTGLFEQANKMFSRNHFQKVMVNGIEFGEVAMVGDDENCYGRPGKLYKLTKEGRKLFKRHNAAVLKTFESK